MKMSSWSYQLVREKNKVRIREVFWNDNNKAHSLAELNLWDYIRDFFMIISDIYTQLRHHHIIDYEKEVKHNKPDWCKELK